MAGGQPNLILFLNMPASRRISAEGKFQFAVERAAVHAVIKQRSIFRGVLR